jgi:hypothetical protein
VTAPTPEQAAAHAFVTGCVRRGITASMAAVPPEGQLATVRGLWADVAQAVVDAATEGSLAACGYTLADVGRFLEAEAAAPAALQAAPGTAQRLASAIYSLADELDPDEDTPAPQIGPRRIAMKLRAAVREAMTVPAARNDRGLVTARQKRRPSRETGLIADDEDLEES